MATDLGLSGLARRRLSPCCERVTHSPVYLSSWMLGLKGPTAIEVFHHAVRSSMYLLQLSLAQFSQLLHTVVAIVTNQQTANGRQAHLEWVLELLQPGAMTTDRVQ